MSHCVAGGVFVPQPGKIRLNLYLLYREHIVVLTTRPPGKSLLLFFLTFGFFGPTLLIFNQFLDQTFTPREKSIPLSDFNTIWVLDQLTTTGWKRTLHSTYYPFATQLWVSPTQYQIPSSEQVECWRMEAERGLRTGSSWWVCPPKYCWVHLPVSAIPSIHLSSTSTTQARWGVFLSWKTEETLHSL